MSLHRTPASARCKQPNRLAAVLRAGLHVGARDLDEADEPLAGGDVRHRYQLHLAHSATSKAWPGRSRSGDLDVIDHIKRRNVIDYALTFDAATNEWKFDQSEEWSLDGLVRRILGAVYRAGPRPSPARVDGVLRPAEQRRADVHEQNCYGPRYVQFFFAGTWHLLAEKKPCGDAHSMNYTLTSNIKELFKLFLIQERDNLQGPRIYYSNRLMSRPPKENQVKDWPDWVVPEDDSSSE